MSDTMMMDRMQQNYEKLVHKVFNHSNRAEHLSLLPDRMMLFTGSGKKVKIGGLKAITYTRLFTLRKFYEL